MSSSPARPSTLQSLITSLLLVTLSFSIAPFSFLFLIAYQYFYPPTRPSFKSGKTVLITGGRTTKSLILIRKFYQAGHRVILAEESQWGFLCATRFSACIERYYPLRNPVESPLLYIQDIKEIILKEMVDLWVPGSSAGGTIVDAEAAESVRKLVLQKNGNHPAVFIQSVDVATTLHHKDLFISLVSELGMETPQSKLIKSVSEGMDFLFSAERDNSK